MNVDDLESVLLRLGACQPALQWLRASGCRTFAEAWAACPRSEGAGEAPEEIVMSCRFFG